MINQKKILGLVLARAGSQGLKNKNIKLINGEPLIAWTIAAAKKSKYIDDLIISTNSEEIAVIARQYGAEAPFLRPEILATSTASSVDAILHAVDWLEANGRLFDIVVLLEPTSPLRQTEDIDNALDLMSKNNFNSVVSCCRVESLHPSFMFHLGADGCLHSFTGIQPNSLRRQDIEPIYFVEGTIYCSLVSSLRQERGFYHKKTLGYVVPKWKSLEIDDLDDFIMVEALMKSYKFKL